MSLIVYAIRSKAHAMNWENAFAKRTRLMQRSTVREILKLTRQPDMISFAGGLPAPEAFPIERFREAADTILAEEGQAALQYSTTEGYPPLRELIAERLSGNGLTIHPDNVLIVSGSQQGLDLIGRILLDDGDRVVIENPSYLGMLMAWKAYDLQYLPIATDDDGMCVDELPPILAQRPKMIYAIPNFQNPGGHTMNESRRRAFVQLIAEHDLPVLEDDAYGELRYSGTPQPSLMQLDNEYTGDVGLNGHVMSVGTFSKTLSPGMRIAWVAAATPVIEKLVQIKQGADLHTSTFNQMVIHQVAREGFLDKHIENLRDLYKSRRDIMLAAMKAHFPPQVTWTTPDGGLFLMVRMPDHVDSLELLKQAIDHKVAFVPGAAFHVGDVGANTFRLNFSRSTPEQIETGIERLGALLHAAV